MYVYIILKLDIRFFNVFILDVFFYFCFLFLYIVCIYIYIHIIIIVASLFNNIIIHNTGGSSHKHVKGLSDRHIPATDIWYS